MNVLAVMDAAAETLSALTADQPFDDGAELREVRAVVADLIKAAEHAAWQLNSIARVFGGTNFTDRYANGPACKARAEALLSALSRLTGGE